MTSHSSPRPVTALRARMIYQAFLRCYCLASGRMGAGGNTALLAGDGRVPAYRPLFVFHNGAIVNRRMGTLAL